MVHLEGRSPANAWPVSVHALTDQTLETTGWGWDAQAVGWLCGLCLWQNPVEHKCRTHMGTADPLQQETSHFCLPVKLCLGHSKLLLSLGGEGSHESSSILHPFYQLSLVGNNITLPGGNNITVLQEHRSLTLPMAPHL